MCLIALGRLTADVLDAAHELASNRAEGAAGVPGGSAAPATSRPQHVATAAADEQWGAAVAALEQSCHKLLEMESIEHLPSLAATHVPAVAAAERVAALLLQAWDSPEQQAARRLELAQAAATRSCAYLRCANVGGEGGPFAGQGADSKRCRCGAAMAFLAGVRSLLCTAIDPGLQSAQ